VYTYRNPKSSPGVFQIADMQSTSLFVLDAESIATLAIAVNRTEAVPRLRYVHKQSASLRVTYRPVYDILLVFSSGRAAQMKAQLAKAWDEETKSFADIYPATGEFSSGHKQSAVSCL